MLSFEQRAWLRTFFDHLARERLPNPGAPAARTSPSAEVPPTMCSLQAVGCRRLVEPLDHSYEQHPGHEQQRDDDGTDRGSRRLAPVDLNQRENGRYRDQHEQRPVERWPQTNKRERDEWNEHHDEDVPRELIGERERGCEQHRPADERQEDLFRASGHASSMR